ncbi:hypothetical protein PG637_05785 [Riemerella anatipestifer]|uniref:hypothetical protein n=1 Tax=Riemerella anatipestifer TaxID=34085 RepID=UPI00129D40B5|nr:hypothetical protein [Riemerella anatipestifer]MDY3318911.1 hypothetical protein [Riemerella anatipestifer]MDY3325182.1 hypothetical protein [Riemerella anatipestifer]MDY3352828.1 hypothetical protein [Riemerella anatipestifer]MRM83867.1 hypothetical protein [Riemerella anatipestifer]
MVSNLNNKHLTDEQMKAINDEMAALEQVLSPININLTSEDRNRYGRVNEQNKLFINKVADFAQAQPNLRVPDVDWDEFFRDMKTRSFLETLYNRLTALQQKVQNTKILHDYDNYQDALADYAYTNYKAGSKSVGYETKQKELKQFFSRSRRKQNEDGETKSE